MAWGKKTSSGAPSKPAPPTPMPTTVNDQIVPRADYKKNYYYQQMLHRQLNEDDGSGVIQRNSFSLSENRNQRDDIRLGDREVLRDIRELKSAGSSQRTSHYQTAGVQPETPALPSHGRTRSADSASKLGSSSEYGAVVRGDKMPVPDVIQTLTQTTTATTSNRSIGKCSRGQEIRPCVALTSAPPPPRDQPVQNHRYSLADLDRRLLFVRVAFSTTDNLQTYFALFFLAIP